MIIGGLGSLWGTLAGGVILGVAQAIGAEIDPGWQLLAGHLAFLAAARGPAARPVPADALRIAPQPAVPDRARHGREPVRHALGALLLPRLWSLPSWWPDRPSFASPIELFGYLALAPMWNLLAGYGGLVSIGQQAFVGSGRLRAVRGRDLPGREPAAGHPARRPDRGRCSRCRPAFVVFRLRGRLLRHRHLGRGRGLSSRFAQISALGGGSGMSLPAAIVKDIAEPAAASRESLVYWMALALARRRARRWSTACCARRWGLALPAIRDQRAGGAEPGRRQLPDASS